MAQIKVVSQSGKAVGTLEVSDVIFGREAHPTLLHEVVTREQACMRQGTHATKTRGLVSGSGRKLWRQKGTGRARVGSIRSPLWKGGGTVQGPQPRDYSYAMPRKKVRAALEVAVSSALREDRLLCVDQVSLDAPKTKGFLEVVKALGLAGGIMVVDEITENLALAARNVRGVNVIEVDDLTPYDVVLASRLVMSKEAVQRFVERSYAA